MLKAAPLMINGLHWYYLALQISTFSCYHKPNWIWGISHCSVSNADLLPSDRAFRTWTSKRLCAKTMSHLFWNIWCMFPSDSTTWIVFAWVQSARWVVLSYWPNQQSPSSQSFEIGIETCAELSHSVTAFTIWNLTQMLDKFNLRTMQWDLNVLRIRLPNLARGFADILESINFTTG